MKPYTWNEIKGFLEKELMKSKTIMTFGTIGSCNIEHDIDVIITKKPSSKISNFYKEVHNLFDKLNDYLKRYNARAVCFTGYEPEFLKLANYKDNDLAIQLMTYVSFSQIYNDWFWAIPSGENINSILKKNYNVLFGKKENVFGIKFNSNCNNSILSYLKRYDRINSCYKEELLIEVMNHYFDFLYRKRLGLKTPIAKNKADVKKYFYHLCDLVDKRSIKLNKNGR
jgi:hypothetical protein